MKNWKVEVLTNCKVCHGKLPEGYRTYCGKKCRNKSYSKRYSTQRKQWARDKRGQFSPDKLRCILCSKWYIQVSSHVKQVHKYSAREYKEMHDLPLSRGVIPKWYRKLKGDQALENKTYKNLECGASQRFTKNDPKAKELRGWKGRKGNKGFESTDYAV